MSMFLDLTSVGTPGHRRDRGCASRHADSIVPKRDGCTSISQSEVGGELATPKLQSFVKKSLMGSTDGKSATVYRPLFSTPEKFKNLFSL